MTTEQEPMPARLDLWLETLAFRTDPEPHIVIRVALCRACEGRPCTAVCPAGLYVWDGNQIIHSCEGCLECGSCRAVCPQGAIAWHYPGGGYGVRYRWG
jgi:ferredoxin like protein